MEASVAYAREILELHAEYGNWEVLEDDGGDTEWYCCFRFPFEDILEDWDASEWDPEDGPILVTTAEAGFVTFAAPFGCSPQAVKSHVERIVEIVADHGLSFRIHPHDEDRTTLDLSYRVYTTGLNSNVIQTAVEALYECNMALVELLHDGPPPRFRRRIG